MVRPRVGGQFPFDPLKPWGKGQEAPLTPEYQSVHDASLADQANGGQGNWPSGDRCMAAGMPAMMTIQDRPMACQRHRKKSNCVLLKICMA